jgi:hypothetical protein
MRQCFFCKVFSDDLVAQVPPSSKLPKSSEVIRRCADTEACERRVLAQKDFELRKPSAWHVCSRCHHAVSAAELCPEPSQTGEMVTGAPEPVQCRCKDVVACTGRWREYLQAQIKESESELRFSQDRVNWLSSHIEETKRQLADLGLP